jgi:hypothetical protein
MSIDRSNTGVVDATISTRHNNANVSSRFVFVIATTIASCISTYR